MASWGGRESRRSSEAEVDRVVLPAVDPDPAALVISAQRAVLPAAAPAQVIEAVSADRDPVEADSRDRSRLRRNRGTTRSARS